MLIDSELLQELDHTTKILDENKVTKILLAALMRLKQGDTKLKRAIIRFLDTRSVSIEPLTLPKLEQAYKRLSDDLNKKFCNKESRKTMFETWFMKEMNKNTRRRLMAGAWVGPFCLDVLDLSRSFKGFAGNAYEICGGIHDHGLKSAKDRLKEKFLNDMGIWCWWIENKDIKSKPVADKLNYIQGLGTPDSKNKRNLRQSIYISTLAHHRSGASCDYVSDLLGIATRDVDSLLKIVAHFKPSQRSRTMTDHNICTKCHGIKQRCSIDGCPQTSVSEKLSVILAV
jgi:hypothetical protein